MEKRPRKGPVRFRRLQFLHGTVRAVPVFGSDGSSEDGFFRSSRKV